MNALRRRLPRLGPWLALLLLVGQSLVQVHATRHELAAPTQHAPCEICILAHSAGGSPAEVQPPAVPYRDVRSQATLLPAAAPRQVLERPRSRAPPTLI